MASPSSDHPPSRFAEDDDGGGGVLIEEEEDEDGWDMSRRMSRLSIEGSDGGDADAEPSDDDAYEEEEEDEVRSEAAPWAAPRMMASLPGTPDRGAAGSEASAWSKDYASETEARWLLLGGGASGGGRRRRRMAREVWLERAWQMRKHRREVMGLGCPVAGGRGGGVAMDMDEVRACKDLGLDLPCDWTVEIPCCAAVSGFDTASSGGNSPSGSWRISSPGDDPKDVKARLKVWAQAVALASASRLGS